MQVTMLRKALQIPEDIPEDLKVYTIAAAKGTDAGGCRQDGLYHSICQVCLY